MFWIVLLVLLVGLIILWLIAKLAAAQWPPD
jgi:hypothetical protein